MTRSVVAVSPQTPGATAVALDLGSMAFQSSDDYLAKAGNLSGLASAVTARANLGLTIGVDVQAWDADLDWVAANLTAAGKALLDDADATAQRTTLGLGAAALIGTPVSVANGGTGLSSGTSGGVPYFSASSSIASSAVLGSTQVVLGGGAGGAPNTNSALTFDGETLSMLRGSSSSTGFGALISRTTTDVTAGTKALLRNTQIVNPGSAPGSLSYLGFYNTIQVQSSNAQDFTGATLRGSSYEAIYAGTGTLLTNLQGMQSLVQQSAGAGPVTTLIGLLASMVARATTTTAAGFDSVVTLDNASGALGTSIDFRGRATGTITAGGALTNAIGVQINNKGKTGVTNAVGIEVADQSGAATSNVNLLLGTTTIPSGTYSIRNASSAVNTHTGNSFFGGTTSPTAKVHLGAGSTAASTAPLKFTSGSLLTTAEAGGMEFLTDKFYGTITTGASRKEFALNDAALTSGTIPKATTNGRLTDGYTVGTSGTNIPLLDTANTWSAQQTTSAGLLQTGATLQRVENTAGGVPSGATGAGLEFFVLSGVPSIQAYDRTGAAETALAIRATPVQFLSVGTTASAANAYLDNGASNSLLRSTSSLAYKRVLGPLTIEEAGALIDGAKPIRFQSKSPCDNWLTEHVGFAAEQIARVDDRFITRRLDSSPDWVQYSQFVAPLQLVAKDLRARLDRVEKILQLH